MLLNSKSILDCNEYEEEIHNKEIELIAEKVQGLPNYNCMVVIKYKDEAHKNRKEQRLSTNLHDFLEMLEYVDMKNGVDLKIGDNNLLTLVAYGQLFSNNNEYHHCITEVLIMPYERKLEFVDISNFLISRENIINELNKEFYLN